MGERLDPSVVSEVIESPALFNGPITVTERPSNRPRPLISGTRLKNRFVPVVFWIMEHAPGWLASGLLHFAILIGRLAFFVPGNPSRKVCRDMALICTRHGNPQTAVGISNAMLNNFRATALGYFRLHREGREAVLGTLRIDEARAQEVLDAVVQHGGVFVSLPHNVGSAFSGVDLAERFPVVLMAKNSANIKRTRLALEVFERMGAKIIMVTDGNPLQLTRTMLGVLRSEQILIGTIDLQAKPEEGGIAATMFGQQVYFPGWAARIPVKAKVPVCPCYVNSEGKGLRVEIGELRLCETPEEAIEYLVRSLEEQILRDPASWAFMLDKRWIRVLDAAARQIRAYGSP